MKTLKKIKNDIKPYNAKMTYMACSDWMSGNQRPLLAICDGYIPQNLGEVCQIMDAAFDLLPQLFKDRDYAAATEGRALTVADMF